jgi:hypothetical protein
MPKAIRHYTAEPLCVLPYRLRAGRKNMKTAITNKRAYISPWIASFFIFGGSFHTYHSPHGKTVLFDGAMVFCRSICPTHRTRKRKHLT